MNIHSYVATAALSAFLLVLAGCTKEREETAGFSAAECRKDLEKLEYGIRRVLEIGKVAAARRSPSSIISTQISTAYMSFASAAERIPADIGPCGAPADEAFGHFQSIFSYSLGVENEADYPARPMAEKEKIKNYAMDEVKKKREKLDSELTYLRVRAGLGLIPVR